MQTAIDTVITFGREGNTSDHRLLYGWSEPEQGFTWTSGPESGLLLARPAAPFGFFVELTGNPFVVKGKLPSQNINIKVNGHIAGRVTMIAEGTWAIYVPPLPRGWDRVLLSFEHPTAARPVDLGSGADRRSLAVAMRNVRILRLMSPLRQERLGRFYAPLKHLQETEEKEALLEVEAAIGIPPTELVAKFESLGDNCEFGLFQRRCGAEPLGLLRFSTAWLRPVIRGLDSEFAGLGDPEHVDPQLDANGQGEWIVYEQQYLLRYHTFIWEHQANRDQVRDQESRKLKFLRRKLMEDVANASKTFVYKRAAYPLSLEEIMPLFLALNRHVDNQLLWVVEADDGHPVGTVEGVLPGLMRGYINRFAPGEMVPQLSVSGWLAVCGNAYRLQKQMTEEAE
jgi:hypothetical protein